jgi:hypothetical protein
MGDDPIYVGNEIPLYDWVYALHFTILNDKGKASEQTHFFHPYMPEATNRETPVANLTKHWLVLPPGYFVGTVIALNPGFFEALKKPGGYVIQTVYSCEGMDANISSNPIGADPNFVHSLPYKSWKGTKEANRIIVHIYQ